MNALAHALRRTPRAISTPAARAAVEEMAYELVPLKNLPGQIEHLPDEALVSVTASPVKTLDDSLDVCADLIDRGHRPIPHLAARMVEDPEHLKSLARRIKDLGIRRIFCIAGDHEEAGAYPDAMAFLREFLDVTAGDIDLVGVASYPDGHAFISEAGLRQALLDKQELFAEAGVAGHAATQICFSADTVRRWLRQQRAEGFELPVHLGVPGVVDRAKLLAMGMRLGVGPSLRYLQKNRNGLVRLFTSPGYNPGDLIEPLAHDFEPLGIEALHVFTFNQVEATRAWQELTVGRGAG